VAPEFHKLRTARLMIEPGPEDSARLRLPASLIKDFQVQGEPRRSESARWPSVMMAAGVALSLALVTGGLWLSRARYRRVITGVSVSAAVVVGIALSGCWDGGYCTCEMPAHLNRRTDGVLAGEVLLETTEKDDRVHLLVGREDLTRFLEQAQQADDPVKP
jgi:hypothetical protein